MTGTCALSFFLAVTVVEKPAALSPLRPQSARFQLAVDLAQRDSATFRSIVEALARHNVIVLIVAAPCDLGRREACFVHQVVTSGTYRFLRVHARDDTPFPRLAGLLAHEIWHALEAVESGVTDADSLGRFFARRGHACAQEHFQTCYETDAAMEVQSRVVDELRQSSHIRER